MIVCNQQMPSVMDGIGLFSLSLCVWCVCQSVCVCVWGWGGGGGGVWGVGGGVWGCVQDEPSSFYRRVVGQNPLGA